MIKTKYHLFLAEMELHGILAFSSEIRPSIGGVGASQITSPFIHNYPLIYAFNRRIGEAYVVIPSLHQPYEPGRGEKLRRRERIKKPLQYTFVERVLREILHNNLQHIYAYPAHPVEVVVKKFFLSAKGYGYVEKVKRQIKSFYPTEVNWVSLVPPSRHRTIIISPHKLPRVLYIRIGMKRTGLFKVELHGVEPTNIRLVRGSEWSTLPVNLYDVKLFNYDVEDFIKVLETRSEPVNKSEANRIGYIRARELFEIEIGGEKYRVPLPKTLFEAI